MCPPCWTGCGSRRRLAHDLARDADPVRPPAALVGCRGAGGSGAAGRRLCAVAGPARLGLARAGRACRGACPGRPRAGDRHPGGPVGHRDPDRRPVGQPDPAGPRRPDRRRRRGDDPPDRGPARHRTAPHHPGRRRRRHPAGHRTGPRHRRRARSPAGRGDRRHRRPPARSRHAARRRARARSCADDRPPAGLGPPAGDRGGARLRPDRPGGDDPPAGRGSGRRPARGAGRVGQPAPVHRRRGRANPCRAAEHADHAAADAGSCGPERGADRL